MHCYSKELNNRNKKSTSYNKKVKKANYNMKK